MHHPEDLNTHSIKARLMYTNGFKHMSGSTTEWINKCWVPKLNVKSWCRALQKMSKCVS